MTDYHLALRTLYPDLEFTINANDYDQINVFDKDFVLPTKAVLDAAYTSYMDANDYKIKREMEYPSQKELTVALWEDVIEGNKVASSELQQKRDTIKLKYPSPK